jgi:hypothetical protein
VQKLVALALSLAVLGSLSLEHLLGANALLHQRMAHSRRRRTPQVVYPIKRLF